MIYLVVALLLLAGLAKGAMDALLFHYEDCVIRFVRSNPQFWDPAVSWQNKYHIVRSPSQNDKKIVVLLLKMGRWLFINPLVFVTDGWHLCQFIFLNSIFSTIAILSPYNFALSLIISILVYGVGFTLIYNFKGIMNTLKSILLSPLTLAFLAVVVTAIPIYFLAQEWTPLAIVAAPVTLFVLWIVNKFKS